jgi:hypothetical protein
MVNIGDDFRLALGVQRLVEYGQCAESCAEWAMAQAQLSLQSYHLESR